MQFAHNWMKQIPRRWWDNSSNYMQKQSTPLGEAVQEILRSQERENPFPRGMDANWALDVQSAQTLDFLAALKSQGCYSVLL